MLVATAKSNNGTVGELFYDIDAQIMMVYTGIGWKAISNSEILYCSMCKLSDWSHQEGFKDHPFFKNNLEYLEYEAARKGL